MNNIPKGYNEDGVRCGYSPQEKTLLEQRFVKVPSKGLNADILTKEQDMKSELEVRYVSNCCGAEIQEPIIDNTARCPECYEGCMVIKM